MVLLQCGEDGCIDATGRFFSHAVFFLIGKYVGSRPIRLKKSTWKDRGFLEVKKREKEKKKLGLK